MGYLAIDNGHQIEEYHIKPYSNKETKFKMKAKLTVSSDQFNLSLEPETTEEAEDLIVLSRITKDKAYYIGTQGPEYMEKSISFQISPRGRSD